MSASEEYKPWFERHPPWFKEQEDILQAAGFTLDNDVLSKERRVQFSGYSKVDPERKLLVAFPHAFPSAPPRIFDTAASRPLSRHHRINDRHLCLFGFNSSRWNATRSVADALAEAEALISEFRSENPTLENQPPEPVTRAVKYEPEAAILVPPPISTFNHFSELKVLTGKFYGKFIHEGDQKRETRGRGIIVEAGFGDEKLNYSRPFSEFFGKNGKEIHGDWFYLPNSPTQESIHAALTKCFQQIKAVKRADYYWFALVFKEEADGTGQSRLTWLVVRANAEGQFHLLRTYPYVQQERYVRIPGMEGLEQKRVTLIGCGSLGSKIAANLAASGVNKFNLVDHDHFEPNNSVRHEVGVEYFGLLKVKALSSRLCSLNPAVAINSKIYNFQAAGLNGFDHEQYFYNIIKESDLIIDATAVHSASHFINELSWELRIPAMFVSVTNGAWGGEIVRSVPGKTPCWVCWLDQYFEIKPPSAPEAAAGVFGPGCDQPTFTGATHELGMVANLATSMAVDTLLECKDLPTDYIRWSGRNPAGQAVFLTEMLTTSHKNGCYLCGSKHEV